MNLLLNGFRLRFDSDEVACRAVSCPDADKVKEWQERLGQEWFTRWTGGNLYCLPLVASPAEPEIGKEVALPLTDYLAQRLIAARLPDRLKRVFHRYKPLGGRSLQFLAQKTELVEAAAAQLRDAPDLLRSFSIRPRHQITGKVVELIDGELEVVLIAGLGTTWRIDAQLAELAQAGVDVRGLYVVRRKPERGQRRLVGRIGSLKGDHVVLAESFEESEIAAADVQIEGSRHAFKRCLMPILGRNYATFDRLRDVEQSTFLTGPGLDGELDKMERFLHSKRWIDLSPGGVRFEVKGRISVGNDGGHATVVKGREPKYCFDAACTKLDTYAWRGLEKYGPYDAQGFDRRQPRILLIAPKVISGRASQFARTLRDGIQQEKRAAFAKGFAGTFHLVNPKFETCAVPPPSAAVPPAAAYCNAIEAHLGRSHDHDVAIVVIEDQHGEGPVETNAYLASKALLLTHGIPVQVCRISKVTEQPRSLQYTLQNIAVALYAKLGGVPWTIDQQKTVDDEVVVGMGTAEILPTRFRERQRFVGITTVFRGDGNYLLSDVSKQCPYDDYPEVLRRSMSGVLAEVKQRNGWQKGDLVRVVFHAAKPLKGVEVANIVRSCTEAVADEQELEFAFLTVSNDHEFMVTDPQQQGIATYDGGIKAAGVPARGMTVQIGSNTRLVCANGPSLIKRADAPLPVPLLVNLHDGSSYRDLAYLSDQVLKFTSLSWRSTLPARRPVTIYYSELIADLLARLNEVPNWSPAVLNTKLKTRKWFL
ncbi:MAG: Piwi domain-containing protein [Planctomycetota bacterium]